MVLVLPTSMERQICLAYARKLPKVFLPEKATMTGFKSETKAYIVEENPLSKRWKQARTSWDSSILSVSVDRITSATWKYRNMDACRSNLARKIRLCHLDHL